LTCDRMLKTGRFLLGCSKEPIGYASVALPTEPYPRFTTDQEVQSPEQRSGLYAGSRIRRFLVRDPLGSDTPGVALVVWP
jgi:hypothetical protein